MSPIDLRGIQPGDLVEYQQPFSKRPTQGTFQRWHATDDGRVCLLVRSQQLGVDLLLDPKRVIRFTRPSEGYQ